MSDNSKSEKIDENNIKINLENIFFGKINNEKLSSLTMNEHDQGCEWDDDYKAAPEQYYWLILGNNVLGVVDIRYTATIDEYNYFWIDTECTFGRSSLGFATSGRLLWCYILNFCSTYGKKFVVYNKATASAKGYHLKMGMLPYRENGLPYQIVSGLENIAGDEAMGEYLSYSSSDLETTFLFYISKNNIDYTSIYDILISLASLSDSFYQTKYIKLRNKYMNK